MKLIPLSKRSRNAGKYFAMVDDADYDFLMQWNWYAQKSHKTYYAVRQERMPNGKQKTISMHIIIMGTFGDKISIDHINHNGLDNQRYNLRKATQIQNRLNSTPRVGASSKYLGVNIRENGRWRAMIGINGKKINIGTYLTEREAAIARDKKALELYGEFAYMNILGKEKANSNNELAFDV